MTRTAPLEPQFRGKNYATDVLVVSRPGERRAIAISLDRAAGRRPNTATASSDEVRILMLHGLLHLTGMDHETDSGEMARAEMRWRKRLGLPDGLIERAHDAAAHSARGAVARWS
jgi:probable rRNA maturation factor